MRPESPIWTTMAAAVALVALTGCGDGADRGSVCVGPTAPDVCGTQCNRDVDCGTGFYCGVDGTCTADCIAGGGECGEDAICTERGQCVATADGGNGSGGDDGGGGGGGPDAAPPGPDADCPSVRADLDAVTPTVMLLIDQSGSMEDNPFGDFSERWLAVEAALTGLGDDGPEGTVVGELASEIRFGVTLYSNIADEDQCPRLEEVAPAIDNYGAIDTLLDDNDPLSETPTPSSLRITGQSLADLPPADPDNPDPRILVLATDGEPDTCADPRPDDPEAAQAAAVTAAQDVFDLGIRTFVLSVGNDVGEEHLQEVANAGVGLDPDEDQNPAPFYVADEQGELVSQFNEIIGGVRSCRFDLDGTVNLDRAGQGSVALTTADGRERLVYGTDWDMVDEDTLEIQGAACETLKSEDDVEVDAQFPCGSIIIE